MTSFAPWSRPLASSAQVCRDHGWTVGTRIVGRDGVDLHRVTISAIGATHVLGYDSKLGCEVPVDLRYRKWELDRPSPRTVWDRVVTAATRVDVDAQLVAQIDELDAHCCEVIEHHHRSGGCHCGRCEDPAIWAARIRCEACGRVRLAYMCQRHRDRLVAGLSTFVCLGCRATVSPVVLSIVRITS